MTRRRRAAGRWLQDRHPRRPWAAPPPPRPACRVACRPAAGLPRPAGGQRRLRERAGDRMSACASPGARGAVLAAATPRQLVSTAYRPDIAPSRRPSVGGMGPAAKYAPPCAVGLAARKGACPVQRPASLPRAAVGAQNAKKGGLPSPSGPLLPPPSTVMACLPVGECGRAGRPCPLSPVPASQETRKGGEGPAGGGRRTGRGRGRAGCRQGSPQP